jgi:hypothetical protein
MFLMINGLILAGAELLRRRQAGTDFGQGSIAASSDPADYQAGDLTPSVAADRRLAALSFGKLLPNVQGSTAVMPTEGVCGLFWLTSEPRLL